jgi:putative ABC transport system permease protein
VSMNEYVRLGVGVAVLIGVTIAVLTWAGVSHRQAVMTACFRAIVQLSFVAAALRGVFAAPLLAIGVVTVMFGVATWTAGRRLRDLDDASRAAVLACGAGSGVAIGLIVGVPILTRDVRTLVAVSGIVFGGTMTAATLTGRRLADGLRRRRDEVEAWLSLGATTRQAVRPIAREAAFEALIPALDQTRTVGLVSLPGAFVGALLSGASTSDAARFQIIVLVGLLCAEAITATTLAHLLGAPRFLPADAASE